MEESKREGVPRAIWSAKPGGPKAAPVAHVPQAPDTSALRRTYVPKSPAARTTVPIAPWSASQRVGQSPVTVEQFSPRADERVEQEQQQSSSTSSPSSPRPATSSAFPQLTVNLGDAMNLSQRLYSSTGRRDFPAGSSSIRSTIKASTFGGEVFGGGEEGRDSDGDGDGDVVQLGETLQSLRVTERIDAENRYLRKRNKPESVGNDPTTVPESAAIAEGMSLPQVSSYLGTHGFLHCTPRYNVERVSRRNFYDLVVLEMPGSNPTGYVWMKKFGGSKDTFVLEPHQLLQLSLDGVISAGAKDSQGLRDVELLSLRDLLREREITERLLELRFFGHFKVCRVFFAWHLVARSRRLRASKRNLLENGLFSDRPVYEALAFIRAVTYELQDVELFHFAGPGSQGVNDFLQAQIDKLAAVQEHLCQRLAAISAVVEAQHAVVTGDLYLKAILDHIKAKHPFLPAEAAGLEIEWAKMRSLQRARDKGHRKIESALLIAHFMIEHALARVLDRFWKRLRYLLRGLSEVDRDGRWDMDAAEANPPFQVVIPESTALDDEKVELVHHHQHNTHHHHNHHSNSRHHHQHHHHHQQHVSGFMQPVSKEWEERGSHLHLDVNLCLDLRPLSLEEMLQTTNSSRLQVRPVPFKLDFLDRVHELCGRIGVLLEALPCMKRHPLVRLGSFTEPNPADHETEELATLSSAKYFSTLHMSPILASQGALQHALNFIRAAQISYADASSLKSLSLRVQETAKRLWSLSPESLAQQLQRSIVMSKVREIMHDPEAVDDIKRAMTRDHNRLGEVLRAAEYLDSTGKTMAQSNPNIKHGTGLITSFKGVMQQLHDFICAAEHRLYTRLPMAFSTRVRNFTEYLKTLEETFEVKALEFDECIHIMNKLKNFECARDAFELEVEVVETVHSMMQQYDESDKSATNRTKAGAVLASTAHQGSKKSSAQSLREASTTSTLFQHYLEARERLLLAMGKGRNSLLAQLNTIKSAALARRRNLHERISNEFNAIGEAERANEGNVTGTLYALEKCGKRIVVLLEDVNKMVATQALLLEAHEIVGSATPVLLPIEVDQFKDMTQLQIFFNAKNQALTCLVDVMTMKRKCLASKIRSNEIWIMSAQLDKYIKSMHAQAARKEEDATLQLLAEHIEDLRPKLEVATFFSSDCLRTRHWKWLGENVFSRCGFALKFAGASSEIISVVDISGKEPVGMGNLSRMSVNEFWQRGVDKHLGVIRRITSEAFMEATIENTLEAIDETLRTMTIEQSSDWISDNRMREAVGYKLNQVTNLTQLSVTLCYCRKTVLVLENTARDMSITCFDAHLEKTKFLLYRLERFANNLHEVQFKWMHMFHFAKFSDRGEVDKDTIRLFQVCTEEMKKMDGDFQTKQNKLLPTFELLTDGDKSTSMLKNNLVLVTEDAHSNIQSLLDAVPRLSLLSYNKVALLVKLWTAGAERSIDFISACMHDMFDGVGVLSSVYNLKQKRFLCVGCLSYDYVEHVVFSDPIPFSLKIEDFLTKFDDRLKEALSSVADSMMLARIQALRAMLRDTPATKVVANVRLVVSLRMKQVFQLAHDKGPNQSYALCNASAFAEDVWLCLGHPMGSLAIAKPQYVESAKIFFPHWRTSLEALQSECKDNIALLREHLRSDGVEAVGSLKMVFRKSRAMLAALLSQEISFIRSVEELIVFKCLESAAEHWAGRYQFHFLYDREERTKQSPFDVGLGCVTIPYGLEYHGGHVRTLPDGEFEGVLELIVGAATSMRASILINHDSNHVPWEAVGEHSVSCRDVASAFGRVLSTLVSVEDIHAVKLFLSRTVYLDAVGCVDFTSIDHAGLQTLMSGLGACWSALQSQDVSIQDWLKFPMKTKLTKMEVQTERSRSNVHNLRMHLLNVRTANVYSGMIVVGIASETFYTDEAVLNYATRSIFTTVPCGNSRPIEALGLLFSCRGFIYGMEIQSIFIATIKQLSVLYGKNRHFIRYICSKQSISNIAENAGQALFARGLESAKDSAEDVFTRLKAEIDVFAAVLWETVLHMGDNHGIPIANLRKDMFLSMQVRLDAILPKGLLAKRIIFEHDAGSNSLHVMPAVANQIRNSTRAKSLVMGEVFGETCARFWSMISNPNNCLAILSGETGCGKTSIRNTVIHAIEHGGITGSHSHMHGGSPSLATLRAVVKVRTFMLSWLRRARQKLHSTRTHHFDNFESAAPSDGEVPEEGSREEEDADDKSVQTGAAPAPYDDHFVQKVHVSVIYHSSLSSSQLLGCFDREGRWSDGILLRKFREIDEHLHNLEASHSDTQAFHLIVLDGPLGYYAEQVFGSSHYHEMDAHVLHKETRNSHLVFPSGEQHSLPRNAMVVLETDDLSHASPAVLCNTPHLHIPSNVELTVSRIISVWCKSIKNWLGLYPPWADALEEIIFMVKTSKFVPDMLYFDYTVQEMKPAVAISRVSSFLRITEELLSVIHAGVAQEATFHLPEREKNDDESSDEDERAKDKKIAFVRDFSQQIMGLNVKQREVLLQRVCLAIAYAGIWGFGGCVNGTERRKFFDSVARDSIDRHFRVPVDVTDDCNVFDASLSLAACRLVHSYRNEDRDEVPKSFDHVQVGAQLLGDRLQFTTPSTTSAKEALQILLCSGAHLLLLGPRGSGKTALVKDLLADLRRNNPTPELIKAHLVKNLLAIISKRAQSADSVGASLEKMKKIIAKLSGAPPLHDDDCDFTEVWQLVQRELKDHWADGARNDCLAKTVYSTCTTLRGSATASDLRTWLEREFATEVANTLEAPGYTYAAAFVDDLHVVTDPETAHDRRMVSDRPEALLKGLMDSTPAFGIKKNMSVLPDGVSFGGRSDGNMERGDPATPVFHRPCFTDPREKIFQAEDYTMQSIGVIAAATGSFHKLAKSSRFCQTVKNFAMVGLPLMNVEEIHVALITGAHACLRDGLARHHQDLRTHITELSRFVMAVNSKIISVYDATNTSDLEKALRTLIVLNIGMVARFCCSLGSGAGTVRNAGGLLQLYSHEWRRYFLDPLPGGSQKDRLIALYTGNLDTADPKEWGVTDDWMQDLIASYHLGSESVWADPSVFIMYLAPGRDHLPGAYVPMQLNHLLVAKTAATLPSLARSHDAAGEVELAALAEDGEVDLEATADDLVVNVNELPGDLLPQSILYPAASSMLLRLVRILSSMKRHILLSGFHGTTRMTAVTLAGKICGYKVRVFDVKENMGVVDPLPSDRALAAVNFRRFLRSVVWQVAGFCKISAEDLGSVGGSVPTALATSATEYIHTPAEAFQVVAPERVLLVVCGAQQLSAQDRHQLLKVIDYDDPCSLFDEGEMLKMSEALRVDLTERLQAQAEADGIKDSDPEAADDISLAPTEDKEPSEEEKVEPEPEAEQQGVSSRKQDFSKEFAKRYSATLSGYGYQWVQRRLKSSLHDMLALALDVDMPRAMQLVCDTTAAAASAINPSEKRVKPAAGPVTGSADAKDMQSRIEEHLQGTFGMRKRFSLLSSHSVAGWKHAGPAVGEDDDEDDEIGEDKADAEYKLPRLDAPPSLHGIFTCPILSPMLADRFCPLWYDVEGLQAIRGVCHALMKPPHELHTSTEDVNEVILSFETSEVGDALGAQPELQETKVDGREEGEIDGEAGEREAATENDEDQGEDEGEDTPEEAVGQEAPSSLPYVAQTFQISVRYEKKLSRLFDFLSLCTKEGIFHSFRHVDSPGAFQHNHAHSPALEEPQGVEEETSILIDEAKIILPHLLCLPSASDALLLSEPIITFGPERTAEVASHLVAQLISKGCEVLMRRQHVLKTTLPALWEALDVIDSRAAAVKTITAYVSEIMLVLRKLSAAKQHVVAELAQVTLAGRLCPEYETEQMLGEEHLSVLIQRDDAAEKVEGDLEAKRAELLALDQMEWQGLAALFSGGAEHDGIELMRAVMVLLHFTPQMVGSPASKSPKGRKKKRAGGAAAAAVEARVHDEAEFVVPALTMDRDSISRHAVGILRSQNIATQLAEVDPLHFSPTQTAALRNLYADLQRMREEKAQRREAELEAEGEFAPKSRPKSLLVENPVPNLVHDYLGALLAYANTLAWIEKDAGALVRLEEEHAALQLQNSTNLAALQQALHEQNDVLSSQIHDIDAALLSNRAKLDALGRIEAHKDEITSAIESAFTYVDAELHQIEDMMACLVADSCVAAVVLVKAGWLPEQMRQECMEQLRRELNTQSVRVSDTPFVMGCLADRMQIQTWTAGSGSVDSALPRDPSAINTLALINLCPLYSYVIDQEGAAAAILCDTTPAGYEQCLVTALKFSIAQLESWVAIAQEAQGRDASLCIVVTDAQAGLSDDLIAFLSAELFVRPRRAKRDAGAGADSHTHSTTHTTSCNLLSWQDTVDHFDLIAELNPTEAVFSYDVPPELHPHGQHGHHGHHGHYTHHTHHSHHSTSVKLCRLRLILTSTRAPSIDAEGSCRPVPSCCLKNMTVVQWPTSTLKSVCVESQPLARAQEKENVAEQFLACKMAAVFLQAASPHHSRALSQTSRQALRLTQVMYEVQNKTITGLFHWAVHDRPNSLAPLHVPGVLHHEAIPLGFLHSESRTKQLVYAQADRNQFSLELDAARSLERELLAYSAAVENIFSTSIEFLRMCGSFLPEEVLPPYALSASTLAAKCVAEGMQNAKRAGLLRHVPQSLDAVDTLVSGLALLQRKRRGQPLPARYPYVNKASIMEEEGEEEEDEAGTHAPHQGHSGLQRPSILRGRRADEDQFARRLSGIKPSTKGSGGPAGGALARDEALSRLLRPHGLTRARRDRAVQAFHYLTQPLRQAFLSAAVEYVQQAARPGMEWIVKLLLLLSTWSQSYPMHTEELRALFHFVHASIDTSTLRFGHYISYHRDGTDLETRMSTCRERKYSLQFDRARRSTLTNTMENIIKIDASLCNRAASAKVHKTAAAVAAAMSLVRSVRWMSRGHGWVDGLLMNRRSERWRIKYVPPASFSGHSASRPWSDYYNQPSMATRHDALMLDQPDAMVVVKTSINTVRSRPPDRFEAEWYQLLGVKLFCAAGPAANAALGVPDGKAKKRLRRGGGNVAPNAASTLAPAPAPTPVPTPVPIPAAADALAPTSPSPPTKRGSFALSPVSQILADEEARIAAEATEAKAAADAFIPTSAPSLASFVLGKKTNVVRRESTARVVMVKKSRGLEALLTTHTARVNFFLLGAHSALERVFGGMGAALLAQDRVEDLIAWKESLSMLPHVDLLRLDAAELVALLDAVRPPSFDADEESDDEGGNGLWVSGYELSVVETMMLAEAIEPGSGGHIAQLHFALVSAFLDASGRIVKNLDEVENEEDDEDQGEVLRLTIAKRPFEAEEEEGDDDDDDDDDDEDDVSGQAVGLEQPGLSLTNSWRKLRAVLQGTSPSRGPQLSRSLPPSKYRATARAYRPWERVLHAVLSEEQRADKFAFMRDLKTAAQGGRSAIFLASPASANHMAVVSMHARDFSNIVSKITPIVNCSAHGEGHGVLEGVKQRRAHMVELQRSIRAAASDAQSDYKVVIEMADISTPTGNALVATALSWSKQGIKVKSVDEASFAQDVRDRDRRSSHSSAGGSIAGSMSSNYSGSISANGGAAGGGSSQLFSGKRSNESAALQAARLARTDSDGSLDSSKPRAAFSPGGLDAHSSGLSHHGSAASMRYHHLLANQGKANAAFVSVNVPQAVLVTSEWGSCLFGQGPLQPLGEMHFSWLPRFFLPDIVSTRRGGAHADAASGLPPSAEESMGILEQELEASLLWMMNSMKVLGRSTISQTLREKFRQARRVELRVTACVVVVWRLAQYVRSAQREDQGHPGLWSHCLAPLNMWQLARVMIKAGDMVTVPWTRGVVYTGGISAQARPSLLNSLSEQGGQGAAAGREGGTGRMQAAAQLVQSSDFSRLTELGLLSNGAFLRAVCLCVEPLGAKVKNLHSRQAMAVQGMSQKAIRRASRAGLDADRRSSSIILPAGDHRRSSSVLVPAAPTPGRMAPSPSSPAGALSPLAQYRRARSDQLKVAEASNLLLNSLSSVNRFFLKDEPAAATGGGAAGAGAGAGAGGGASASAKADTSKAAKALAAPTPAEEAKAQHARMRAMCALYFAELAPQIRYRTQEEISRTDSFAGTGGFEGLGSAKRPGAKAGAGAGAAAGPASGGGHLQNLGAKLSRPMVGRATKLQPNKFHAQGVDVTNEGFILSESQRSHSTPLASPAPSAEAVVADLLGEGMFEAWPAVEATQHDVHIGALLPAEVILFLVEWTMREKDKV